MAASSKAFSLTVSPDGALLVSSEIDLTAADDFPDGRGLDGRPHKGGGPRSLRSDVIDSGGLKAIMRLAVEACPLGVVIQAPRDNVLRVLDIVEIEQFAGIRVERQTPSTAQV